MIIITGASKGIGRFLFDRYSKEGLDVIGTYNSSKDQNTLRGSMFKVDITNKKEVDDFFFKIKDRLKDIILINSAGVNYSCFAHNADLEDWRKVFEVNLFGTFHMIRNSLQIMRKQNYGRIINISSVVAQSGTLGTSAYAASKSSLWGLTKAIAIENGQKGITINTLNLGYFNIGMIDEIPQFIKEDIKSRIPVGHQFGSPDNIFEAINFIIKTPYLTGTSIDLNGGII